MSIDICGGTNIVEFPVIKCLLNEYIPITKRTILSMQRLLCLYIRLYSRLYSFEPQDIGFVIGQSDRLASRALNHKSYDLYLPADLHRWIISRSILYYKRKIYMVAGKLFHESWLHHHLGLHMSIVAMAPSTARQHIFMFLVCSCRRPGQRFSEFSRNIGSHKQSTTS